MKKFVVNDNKEEKVEKFEISKPSSNAVEVKTKEQKNPLGKNLKQKTIELNSGKKESFKLEENNNCFESKGKLLKGRFAKSISEKELVRLDFNNHALSLGLKEKTGKRRSTSIARVLANEDKKSSISFEEFEANTDLKYDLFEDGLKESIVVKQRQDKYEYEFILQIGDLTPVFNEENNTLELKKDNKTIYRVMTPFMFDANENYSDDCSYEIEEVGSGTLNLTLKASSEWIDDVQRVFPITIDPTIIVEKNEVFSMQGYFQLGDNKKLPSFTGLKVGVESKSPIPNILTTYTTNILINCEDLKKQISNSMQCFLLLRIKDSNLYLGTCLLFKVGDTVLKSVANINRDDLIKLDISSLVHSTEKTLEITSFHDGITSSIRPTSSFVTFHEQSSVEEYRPKLIIESFEEDIDDSPMKEYSACISGTTSVNIKTGNFKHEHDDNASISHNSLSLSLSHVFDSKAIDDNSAYFGKGWKSNFHQRLEKSDSFNKLLGSKDITYVDGQGKKHLLHEKWYYLDENKVKKYIERDDVYLDSDQKLKYKIDDEHVYEVKYDVESDEGLIYFSANSTTYFNTGLLTDNYNLEIECANGERLKEIELINSSEIRLPKFMEVISNNKIGIPYEHVNLQTMKSSVSGNPVERTELWTLKLQADKNGVFIEYPIPLIGDGYITKSYLIISNETVEYDAADGIYINEDILNINAQIKNLKATFKSRYISMMGLITSLDNLDEQIKYKKEVIDLPEYKKYQTEYESFYKKDGWGDKALVQSLKKSLIDIIEYDETTDNIYVISNKSLDTLIKDNFTEFIGIISNYLQKINHGLTIKSNNIKNRYAKNIYDDLELGHSIKQLDSYKGQLELYFSMFAESQKQLSDTVEKRKYLISQQKRQVNDFIIDKEGNILGFDGYGRLIVIQDKYENKIEIGFGYEDENEGKMLSIFSESQTIKFNYDKTSGLLSSIIDAQGRKTKYSYLNNNLVTITYNDKQKTQFEYEDFAVISSLLEKTIIAKQADGSVVARQYCYDGRISHDSFLDKEKELRQIVDHKYVFDADYQTTTIIDDKTKKQIICYFDHRGRVIKQVDEENTSVAFYDLGKVKSKATYKTDESKSVLDYLTVHDGPCSYQLNLNHYQNLPISNMVGLKLDVLTGNVDNDSILSFKVKATVRTTKSDGTTINETFEQEYQEVKLQTVVLPIVIDRNLSYQIDIAISSDSSDFTSSYLGAVDLISLEEGTIYSYDAKDRLIKEQNGYSTVEYSDFNEDNVPLSKTDRNIYGEEVSTHYSYNANKQITLIEDSKENVVEYYYDTKGNCIEKRSYNKKDASLMKVEKTNYDEQGRVKDQTSPIKDEEGKETKTSVSYLPGTNKENKVEQANGENISYSYDYNNGNLLSISSSASGINNSTSFTYNYGLLTSLSHHGVKVNYTYDGLGRKTVVALNDEEVMWNQYLDDYNSKNDSNYSFDREIKQGNYQDSTTLDGLFSASYTNYKGQVLYTKYSGDESVGKNSYFYDENNVSSTVSTITYRDNDQTYKEESLNTYNEFKQLVKQEKKVNDVSQVILEDHYDETNRFVTSGDVIFGEEEYRLNYLNEYDEEHRLISNTVREGIIDDEEFFTDMEKVSFKYDVLNRVIHNDISTEKMSLCHEYSYLQQDENTLDLIAEDITKIKVVNQGNTTYLTETSTYQYDVSGNITKIITDEDEIRYTYDKLNRLIREDNPTLNKTITYKYDKAGNILLKKTYAYTLEGNLFSPTVDEYVYDCEGVRDRLISFNNKTIEYDSMGRPTTYKDDQYEWNNQGQLTYILKQNMDEISYLYDTNGIRRKKIVNGVETTFITNGTQILSMKKENKTFVFRYVLNKLVGFNYNDGSSTKEYIYHRNIQGDILGIYDDEGNQVGGYAYDAYGHHVVTLDINGIATLNPFRYRGYFYDDETNLYYLNSRYYDPETGRFISPDILSILDETRGQINGLNLYMYCGDNPVMRIDPSGMAWWHWLIGGVVLVGLAIAVVATAGAAGVGIGAAFAAGFTGATLVGTAGASVLAVTLLSSAFAGAFMASMIGLVAGGMTFTDGKIGWDWNGASEGFMWGAVTGALGGAGSNGLSNIGNGLGKVAKFLVQAGLNGVLSGSITTIQGLITGDVSWESSVLSFVFGTIGGGVGVTNHGEWWKNLSVSFGLGVGEASIGELIEFFKSWSSHSVTRLFKQQYAY